MVRIIFFGLVPHSLGEGAVKQDDAFAVLGQKQSINGEVLRSDYFPELNFPWLSQDHFCYSDVLLAVQRYLGEAPSTHATDPGVPASSPDSYIDVDGESGWDLKNLIAMEVRLEHTVLKTKFTELQEACLYGDFLVPSSVEEVDKFSLARMSALVAGDLFSDGSLRRNTEVSDLQVM